jgi:1-phosphofructokinase family hexose kinase
MILSVCPNPAIDTYWFLGEIKPGEAHRLQAERRYPGGKGTHVAMAVAEMGTRSELIGFWAGPSGKWLRESCQQLGICCHGPEVPGDTRTCLTLRTAGNEWHDTEFLGIGPALQAADYLLFIKMFKELLPHASVVVMSGSWPPGAPENPYGPLIDLAQEQGIPVWLDCTGEALRAALPHRPFGLHLNKKEAAAGVPASHLGPPEDYYLQYVHRLALTAGKDGLLLFSANGEAVHAVCKLEKIVSAVGSGDCLTAGLALGQHQGLGIMESAQLATACGSANCLREELGMFYKKDVVQLLAKTAVAPIK